MNKKIKQVILLLLCISSDLADADNTWIGSVNTDFMDSANWSPAGTPNGIVTIAPGAPHNPIFSNTSVSYYSISSLPVNSGGVLTVSAGELRPGSAAYWNGDVLITGGSLNVRNNIYIGSGSGSGVVTMTGGTLTCKSVLTVGYGSASNGLLNIWGGEVYMGTARVAYNGATGKINVRKNGIAQCTGDAVSFFTGLVDAGLLTTEPGWKVEITYDETSNQTIVKTMQLSTPKRYMEKLDRGVVAVWQGGSKVYIGWRMFGTDPMDIAFNVYRDSVKINTAPIIALTNYIDTGGSAGSIYSVAAVIDGVEQEMSNPVAVWSNFYHDIPLQVPVGGTTPDGVSYTYSPNDASAGDVDGDGQYEIILKWDPSNAKDNSQSGYTGNVYLDAYKIDGTFLWRIDLGVNIRAGAHYTQFMVYDFDGDGKAEMACKTADGTVDGIGKVIGDPSADWRNSSGYILAGPEYFTVFDGQTGAILDTANYVVPRHPTTVTPIPSQIRAIWGDDYGNRVDRFLACVAYLDGERPSIVMCRGYYTRTVLAAWDYRYGKLSLRWVFDSDDGTTGNSAYRGQGNHNLSVADVDGDGKDEIMYGACAIDDNGKGLYSTGLGHGDAMHVSDLDTIRPGLEVFTIHEGDGTPGASFRDANTGQILWQTDNADVGRGVSADIDARYPGYECWGFGGIRRCTGELITGTNPSSTNFAIWWDGDLLRELLDGTKLDKWNAAMETSNRLLTAYNYEAASNNGTKSNPCLQADILGDWREEIIYRTSDNTRLRIFTTTIPAAFRIYTLMHDPVYRLGAAWQNVAYNQPPHTGFYLGEGMTQPPYHAIRLVGDLTGTVLREWWTGIAGDQISNLTSSPNYPNNPSGFEYLPRLEIPSNWNDSYGCRIRGYLRPIQSGSYTFWMAGDDSCELWLSSDATPDKATQIASVPGWTDPYQWNKFISQQSVPVELLAGRKYYLEVLHKEKDGVDHMAVAWQGPGISRQIIDGTYLIHWAGPMKGDVSGDGFINHVDFSMLASQWLNGDCTMPLSMDLDGDCEIELDDYIIMASNWLE
ncbi:MAG: PA14 domain-containing protein [Anaerohalosphaeraceae bacterium]